VESPAARAAALPPAVRDARLAAYGERLFSSITAAAPKATWVMQGWLFGADKAFWTPEAVRLFSRVPSERMLVLDIGNDRYPGIWQKRRPLTASAGSMAMSIITAAATRPMAIWTSTAGHRRRAERSRQGPTGRLRPVPRRFAQQQHRLQLCL
jgi:hypothetical protein